MTQTTNKPEQAPKPTQNPTPNPDRKATANPEKHDGDKKDNKAPQTPGKNK